MRLVVKAFEEGVKAALRAVQSPEVRQGLAKAAQTVIRNMNRAVKAASKVKKV